MNAFTGSAVPELAAWRGRLYSNDYQKNGQRYRHYRLVYQNGGRRTLGFKTIEAAMAGIKDLVLKLGGSETSVVLANNAAAQYQQAMQMLNTLPSPPALNIAIAEYVEIKRNRGHVLPSRTIQQVVDEMINDKEAAVAKGELSTRHVEDLAYRLNRFGSDLQIRIADLHAPAISAWLRGLGLSARSQNNFRGAIQCLATFAKSCGYLPRDWNELEAVPTAKAKNGKIEIFTPDEIRNLLKHANGKLAAFVAIGAFAGLRSAELERLTWGKVDLKRGYITVDAEIAKTNSRRVVPIQPNLAKLLRRYVQKDGRICVYGNVTNELLKLAKAAGVEWKQNALRHSYASYRLAVTQDAAKVALEMGNSPQMIFQHYRELVTPEQGKEWFKITATQQ